MTPGLEGEVATGLTREPAGSSPDGCSGPQKNFLKKRLRAARMQRWAWTKRPSTLKVTSLKAWPLMRRFK